jgi:mRNA interferase MazF
MIRGEVWMASLDPVRGSEQAGTRPVIVLQTDPLNSFLRTIISVPLTTNLKWGQYPFCVFISVHDGGLTSDSIALCHQLRVSDKSRLIRRLGQVSALKLSEIEKAVAVTLGI